MRKAIVLVFAVLGLVPAAPAPMQQESVFHSTTQLVQIDVAAQDRNGKPVTDLTKDDFELFVNHKPQPIATFTETSIAPAPAVALPRGSFSNKQETIEVSQGRYTVFLLDWRNTNWQMQSFAHQQMLKMLADLPAGSKVALYLNNYGLQIVQEFTSDHELIKDKVAGLFGEIPPPQFGVTEAERSANDTVAAFQAVAKHLAGISGQKLLIWVSTGFPDAPPGKSVPPGSPPVPIADRNESPEPAFLQDIDKAVRTLGNANIVLEATQSAYPGAMALPELGPTASYVNSLQMIAERTGGKFYPADTNDFAATLRSAANDRTTSYQLGYYAGDNLQPGLQPFEIRSKRPGITLRYREGYYIDKKPPVVPSDPRVIAQDALEGAVDAVAVPMTASAVRTMGNMPNIMVQLNVDPTALTFQQDGNLWRGKFSVFARFAGDEDDQMGDVPVDSPALALTQEQHDRLLLDGLTQHFTMKLPQGATTLRVLVRDGDSGHMGSVTISLEDLPQF